LLFLKFHICFYNSTVFTIRKDYDLKIKSVLFSASKSKSILARYRAIGEGAFQFPWGLLPRRFLTSLLNDNISNCHPQDEALGLVCVFYIKIFSEKNISARIGKYSVYQPEILPLPDFPFTAS
jgi:hypothetical protein